MRLLLFVLFTAFATAEIDDALQCTICQFSSHFLYYKGNNTLTKEIDWEKTRQRCSQMKGCQEELSYCEMVTHIESILPHSEEFRPLQFAFRLFKTECLIDPNSKVIQDIPLPSVLSCPICKLLYNTLSGINNGINNAETKYGSDIVGLLEIFCDLLKDLVADPAFCYPLLENNNKALLAILQGVQDSFGDFYKGIGKFFSCPDYQDLFIICD